MAYMYYIDLKQTLEGLAIKIKKEAITRRHNNKINGHIFESCCFDSPVAALEGLKTALEVMHNDYITEALKQHFGLEP